MDLKFYYQDHEIIFSKDEEVMVNATQMAKAFGKRIDFFLKAEHTQAFMEVAQFPPYGGNSDSQEPRKLVVTKGHLGTWMHRVLALKFAAWLDPKFEFWVFSTIEEILFGNQFKAVRHWYDETHRINNRAIEIRSEQSKLRHAIKDLEEVKQKKEVQGHLNEQKKLLAYANDQIRIASNIFSLANAEELEQLVAQRTALLSKIADLSTQLDEVLKEYLKLDEVQQLNELSLELKSNSAHKRKLTKDLYQGQLVPAQKSQ